MDQNLRDRYETEILTALDAIDERPAQWGVDDCALWVANIVKRVTGVDPAATWRGNYADRDGATAVLGSLGLGFAIRQAAKTMGWRHIDANEADTGDIGIIMVPTPDGSKRPMTMICRVRGWFVGRSEDGFLVLDASAVKSAWAVA